MPEFYSINRDALLARPSAAMLEWVNSLYPEDEQNEYTSEPSHDDWDVFLLPESEDYEEGLDYVEQHCDEFLAIMLEDWCLEEERWPSPLDWDLFNKFLEYSVQTVVMDTVSPEEDEEDED